MEDVVFPQTLNILGLPIRDTVLSTMIMIVVILVGIAIIKKYLPELLEQLILFVSELISENIGDANKERYVPFLGALIVFLAVANIFGVVPRMQTPTKDINTTLACALIVFFAVHIYGVRERGLLRYLKTYATPMAILDIISQLSRTMSLTLRLFANVISGEFIVAVIFFLVPPVAPLVLMILSMITGLLQAYVFTVLASSYISSVVASD